MKTLFNIKSTLNRIRVLTTFLVTLLVSVQVWGIDETIDFSGGVASSSSATASTTITWTATSCTIVQSKGVSSTNVNPSYKAAPRWYVGNTISITPASGITITKIVLTGSSATYHGQDFTFISGTGTITKSGNVTTITGSWSSTFEIKPGKQFRTGSVVVTYSTSCTSISPSLSYTSTTLTVGGGNSSTPTVSGNTGGGTVTYAISATPSGCATINTSTGVVTPVAAGSATVTATIGAKGSYCEGTATKNFTINAAACSNTVTINKGTATGCSFTLSKSGAQESCSGVTTTVTITPNTGYQVSSVTQSGASSAPSITGTGNTRTVTYAANTTGTSTINVTCTKVNYTVTLDRQSGTGGSASVTATYGDAMPSATMPTREGYNFGGYYDATGGSGTQYYTATGTSARTWNKTSNTTLYAKWTIKTYTVTWKVNDTNYTTGTPSTSVNHGSKVTTLPTAPSPASYCGDKFVGWTTDENYTHGTSPLFTTASAAPTASDNQTFYAVFADYAD